MWKSKEQKLRFDIIDSELASKPKVKTSHLKKKIESETGIQVSLKTIQNDLNDLKYDIKLNYLAPIEYDKQNKAYYYSDPNYTIKTFGLKEEDIRALLLYSKILDQYKGHEIFEQISKSVEKIIDKYKIRKELKQLVKDKSLVQIEKAPVIKGIEFTPHIVSALEQRVMIEFDYTPFETKIKKHWKVMPLLLKEDGHMWYLIGKRVDKPNPTTFGLDRITNLKIAKETYDYEPFDSEEYFKHSFGITVPDVEPIEVVLSFTAQQGNYVNTLPIHPTQKLIKENKKEYRISVTVKPSYEFYAKVLSYGEKVKVISPSKVVDEIGSRLKSAVKVY